MTSQFWTPIPEKSSNDNFAVAQAEMLRGLNIIFPFGNWSRKTFFFLYLFFPNFLSDLVLELVCFPLQVLGQQKPLLILI